VHRLEKSSKESKVRSDATKRALTPLLQTTFVHQDFARTTPKPRKIDFIYCHGQVKPIAAETFFPKRAGKMESDPATIHFEGGCNYEGSRTRSTQRALSRKRL
jgi:hypothetical protein